MKDVFNLYEAYGIIERAIDWKHGFLSGTGHDADSLRSRDQRACDILKETLEIKDRRVATLGAVLYALPKEYDISFMSAFGGGDRVLAAALERNHGLPPVHPATKALDRIYDEVKEFRILQRRKEADIPAPSPDFARAMLASHIATIEHQSKDMLEGRGKEKPIDIFNTTQADLEHDRLEILPYIGTPRLKEVYDQAVSGFFRALESYARGGDKPAPAQDLSPK